MGGRGGAHSKVLRTSPCAWYIRSTRRRSTVIKSEYLFHLVLLTGLRSMTFHLYWFQFTCMLFDILTLNRGPKEEKYLTVYSTYPV
jgi:hypothetical protein